MSVGTTYYKSCKTILLLEAIIQPQRNLRIPTIDLPQQTSTCSESTVETLEKGVK